MNPPAVGPRGSKGGGIRARFGRRRSGVDSTGHITPPRGGLIRPLRAISITAQTRGTPSGPLPLSACPACPKRDLLGEDSAAASNASAEPDLSFVSALRRCRNTVHRLTTPRARLRTSSILSFPSRCKSVYIPASAGQATTFHGGPSQRAPCFAMIGIAARVFQHGQALKVFSCSPCCCRS